MKAVTLALAAGLGVIALSPIPVFAASAGENHAAYAWLVGVDGPDIAMAPDGSTVTLSGRGTVQAGPGHTASGDGTYALSSGGSGSWTVSGLLGFVSYGSGAAQGLPANLFGGEAKVRVHLDNGTDGVLTITCELGSPPAGHMEGVTLILGQGGEFTAAAGGGTVFIQ